MLPEPGSHPSAQARSPRSRKEARLSLETASGVLSREVGGSGASWLGLLVLERGSAPGERHPCEKKRTCTGRREWERELSP